MMKNKEPVEKVTPEGEGKMSEAEIDRNLQDTFPASDPPSWTLGTDHRADTAAESGKDDEPSRD